MTDPVDTTETTGRIRDGYEAARDATVKTATKAADAVSDTARRATHGLESNPIGLLVGGIAIGAAIGALIPRSTREKDLLAPLGQRVATTARTAIAAAKDAGKAELETRGLTRDAARSQVKSLFDGVLKAANSAGTAATRSAANKN